MKTIFPQRNKSLGNYRKLILVVFIIFVVGSSVLGALDGLLVSIVRPFWVGENILSRGFRNTASFFQSQYSLVQENARLKEELNRERSIIFSQRLIESKYDTLMSSIGRPIDEEKTIGAVLVHPPKTPYDTLIIDIGKDHQVNVGDTVELIDGSILGRVSEIYEKTSRVRLFSTNGEKTNAILERHWVSVELIGQGAGNYKLKLPRGTKVEIGDKILTSNLDSNLLAVVGDVSMQPTDSFKEVLARVPTNIFSVRFVVLKRNAQ